MPKVQTSPNFNKECKYAYSFNRRLLLHSVLELWWHATGGQFMTKIISLFNQAGGVGKTTIALNLGYHLSLRGHKVLLIDIDPQGSLTLFMGVDSQNLDKTVFDAIVNEEPLSIHTGIHGMDLAPTNINLSAAEIQLVNMDFREVRLKMRSPLFKTTTISSS
jgi:chromosome partitioning protein